MSKSGSSPAPPGGAVRSQLREGVAVAAGAYVLWGLSAAYYKLLADVPLLEVMANRALWSLPLVGLVLVIGGDVGTTLFALKDRRTLATLAASSAMIATSWGAFVWGVGTGRLLEVSFGYYLNPLVSVALGVVLLGERLRPMQIAAVGLAGIAVLVMGIAIGTLPWLPLVLAVSFALYGYLRKTVGIGAAGGLMIELVLLMPFAAGYTVWAAWSGNSEFTATPLTPLWLALTAPWTVAPLILFAAAARRLRLSTVGLMQYIAPSIHFVLAVAVFGEKSDPAQIAAFVLTWVALVIYSRDSLVAARRSS